MIVSKTRPTNDFLKWLVDSGITIEEVNQLGWRIIENKEEIKRKLGYSPKAKLSFETAIEIPYRDEDGRYLFSRFRFLPEVKIGQKTAKYLGPKGQKPIPYIPKETIQKKKKFKEELWITEGEKKALRLVKENKVAIGIQGIWNYGKKEKGCTQEIFSIFSEIKEYLGGGRKVILAFDSDFQRNSQVLLALYTLALLLQKENVKVYIAKWDESDGKGIDDFLNRKVLSEIQKIWFPKVIQPEDKAQVIKAMRKAKTSDSQLFNHISMALGISTEDLIDEVKGKSKTKFWEDFEEKTTQADTEKGYYEIANFIAKIEAQYINDEGDMSCKLNLTGKKTVSIEIPWKEIVFPTKFKEAIGSKGPFLYRISSNSIHCDFLSYLIEKSSPEIRRTKFLGKVESDKFLFSNCLVTTKGIEEISSLEPPKSRMDFKAGGDLREIVGDFAECYGLERTWKIFGFAVGTLFVKDISDAYGFFPLLFLYGSKGSGKSKLAELITWLFGAGRELRPFNFNSTAKAIQRVGTKFKGVPITLNEYQSNPTKNNRLILSLYDREGYHRAKTDNSLDTIQGEVNGSCIVISTQYPSGEESEAVLSRLIDISLEFEKFPERKKAFNRLWTKRDKFSCFVPHCLKEIQPVKGLLETIQNSITLKEKLYIPDQRIIENYSIIEACSAMFFASLGMEDLQPIQKDVIFEIKEKTRELKDSSILNIFLTALENINEGYNPVTKKWLKKEGESFYFSLPRVYPEVKKYLKQADLPIPDKKTISKLLKSAGYEYKNKYFDGERAKAFLIRAEHHDY